MRALHEAGYKLSLATAKQLVEEIGSIEYCWLVLKAVGVPAHDIPDDPQLLLRKMAKVAAQITHHGITDEKFFALLGAMAEAGSPKVKELVAAEMLLIKAVKERKKPHE